MVAARDDHNRHPPLAVQRVEQVEHMSRVLRIEVARRLVGRLRRVR
jgi:hypothetical protein